jgi:hypothetical protein
LIFTPGGGLGGLARGYKHAAPPGLRKGEPNAYPANRRTDNCQNGCCTRFIRYTSGYGDPTHRDFFGSCCGGIGFDK